MNNKNNSLKKNLNAQMVLDSIRYFSPISRNEIAEKTNLSVPTVSRIVNKLFEDGYLEEEISDIVSVGRKTNLITLKKRCVLTAGVEYDGDVLKIAILDEEGNIIENDSFEFYIDNVTPIDVATKIYKEIKILFLKANLHINELFGIGIGLPGIVNNITGEIIFSAQLNFRNINFKNIMEEISGVKCIVENDLKAIAYAEYLKGNGKNSNITVLVSLGSGIGTALIMDGKILRGVSNTAGELGHITNNVNGSLCNCGKLGCLQTNVAKNSIIREASRFAKVKSLDEIFEAAEKGKKWAKRITNRIILYSAIAIETAVCAYNPDTVILCGSLLESKNNIFDEIVNLFLENYVWEYLKGTFQIKRAGLDGFGCLTGSAILVQELFFDLGST